MVFIVVVMYVAFSLVNTIPGYFAAVSENNLKAEAWTLSELVLSRLGLRPSGGGAGGGDSVPDIFSINITALEDLSACNRTNYMQQFKPLFNISDGDMRLVIDSTPVALLFAPSGTNFTGSATINGTPVSFETFKSNATDAFDRVLINGAIFEEGNVTEVAGANYTVAEISPEGRFVILKRNMVDCGLLPPSGVSTSNVKRFATLDNTIAPLELEYWRYY